MTPRLRWTLKPSPIEPRQDATLRHVTYASPRGGDVTATVVEPDRTAMAPPAVLFMHWGQGTRFSFLDEALSLASLGVRSLLIDAPWVRPGAKERPEAKHVVQTVIDLRRGVDLLSGMGSKRIGYVGHSYGSWVGAILAGLEPRLSGFVLAGGLASNADATGDESIRDFDAEKWVAKTRAPVFLQFAVRW